MDVLYGPTTGVVPQPVRRSNTRRDTVVSLNAIRNKVSLLHMNARAHPGLYSYELLPGLWPRGSRLSARHTKEEFRLTRQKSRRTLEPAWSTK